MVKIVSAGQLRQLQSEAAGAARRRTHLNIHESLGAEVQRLFIATEPDTYMRPHRHPQSHKWEFFVVLAGTIDLLYFDDGGVLQDRIAMGENTVRAVEVPPGVWHAYLCRQPGTLALEVKQGAYIPTAEADFAPWSPAEGSRKADHYLQWMRVAQKHDNYSAAS